MQLGFIGLKYSGKSTLFELLTQGKFESVHSGMAEYHRGQVMVPDERIDRLSAMFRPKKTTYAYFDCIDVMGIPASLRTDQAAKYMEAVRQTDSLVAVIQVFDGYDAEGKAARIDPVADLKRLEEDIIFADLIVADNRLEKVRHLKVRSAPQFNPKELDILEKCKAVLEENRPLRNVEIHDHEDKLIRGFQFLSKKPLMAVLNCDEAHYAERAGYENAFREAFPGIPVTSVSALGEKEIQELEEEERLLFMQELGIEEPAIHHVIATSYAAFGLISFFTVGEDEVRAWTLRAGAPAPEAAGTIHSDLQKGFIRAEVIAYDDFIREGSMAAAKAKGLVRLEGKEYPVKDGDILNIRFNV
ncbi:MAG: redox-regulated ATPase YchF [Candidatus Marinimicrobia bacterium]|nr:redox-regulated ATPase YchF [Candidatus Neomarinimicrobiota bacterium]